MSAESATDSLLEEICYVASVAAKKAGALIRSNAGSAVDKTKATSQDLVTETDKACQNIIEDAVKAHFPSHVMLGEESVPAGVEASAKAILELVGQEWLWVVDPIDGTTNFVQGLPCSVVSIGVAHRGSVVVGVIYEPYRDELYTAIKGKGSRLNGVRIHVADVSSIKHAVFGFGTHYTKNVCSAMLRAVGAVAPISRGVRSFGSAALHLAYTSCGRLTGFWELDLSSWDVAAGSLLVQEAGGKVTDTRGEPFTLLTRDIFASNGADDVHSTLLRTIASVHAEVKDPKSD